MEPQPPVLNMQCFWRERLEIEIDFGKLISCVLDLVIDFLGGPAFTNPTHILKLLCGKFDLWAPIYYIKALNLCVAILC